MTLRDLLQLASDNPALPLAWFTLPPFTALVALVLGRSEGHLSPWKWLYSVLAYMACVPGIFAIALSVYNFLFERRSLMDMDVYAQILPVVSMFLTLWLIRKNVEFKDLPWFEKLSSLVTAISAGIVIMYFLDRLHIYAISFVPIQTLLLIFLGLVLLIRFSFKRLFS